MSLRKLRTALSFNSKSNSEPSTSTDAADQKSQTQNVSSKFNVKGLLGTLDPVVGFQMTLIPSQKDDDIATNDKRKVPASSAPAVPELQVRVIGARHLPSLFGLKTVQGYVIKIKLFPGTARFDTAIQTSSWPTFNETFKFPLESTTKSTFRKKPLKGESKGKPAAASVHPASGSETGRTSTIFERVFRGHFLVLTVFALLELPESGSSMKNRLQAIRRKSSQLPFAMSPSSCATASTSVSASADVDTASSSPAKNAIQLTGSEQRRNVGSVTCFLDARLFDEDQRTGTFVTNDIWLAIKDITVTAPTPERLANMLIPTYPKGQLELIWQICTPTTTTEPPTTTATVPAGKSDDTSSGRWSFGDVRRKLQLSTTSTRRPRDANEGLCLKIVTSRMRCSIKCKEEFENMDNTDSAMYIKTAVYEHDILSAAWKSDHFAPSLSVRWQPDHSELSIPLNVMDDLQHITVRTTIATKTKLGKKIVLGVVLIGGGKSEHWSNVAGNAGSPVAMWHAFE